MFDIEMIEQAAFMYLRALSFQSIVDILRSWFEKDIFSKRMLVSHIERLADTLPKHDEVTSWLQPKRSGFYALDLSPYNNTLEGFNYLVKRKTRLMKGFKKDENIYRWLKLVLLDWRFHSLASSEFFTRKG